MWTLADDLTAKTWDEMVAAEGGHPLQTALWGNARARADGAQSERLLLEHHGHPALLARVEMRLHQLAGKIAWLPQGPIYIDAQLAYSASMELKAALKARGYQLCFENPYSAEPPRHAEHGMPIGKPTQTSILDLSIGEAASWRRLSSNWRNNVRAAERSGVRVNEAHDEQTIKQFVAQCERLSVVKGFRYKGSVDFITRLLLGSTTRTVCAKLYSASVANTFHGGLLIMIVGGTMQLMFSAAVRGEQSSSRLLHWTAIKAAMNAGVTRYDLGGMDREGNPGVYEFKRQLRGQLVTIPPIRAFALSVRGRMALIAGSVLGMV